MHAVSAILTTQRPRRRLASREARSWAAEEAREADQRREAAEERARELLAWCHSLEEQVELHEASLASMKVASGDPAELQKREEALTLEAAERTRVSHP